MNPVPQYESGTRYFETLYESEPVRKMEGEDSWICGFPQRTIQPGQYVLAVPYDGNELGQIFHRVNIDFQFENIDAKKTTEAASPVLLKDAKQHFQFEFLIGDAYTLEEALLHNFSHIYADNILQLLKGIITRDSKEPVGQFKMIVNQLKSIHDGVSGMFSAIKLDNKYFKAVKNVKDIFGDVWGTSNFKKMQDAIEEAKLADLPDALEDAACSKLGLKEWQEGFDKVTKPVELVGKVFEAMDCFEKAGNLYNATQKEKKSLEVLTDFMRGHLNHMENGIFRQFDDPTFNRSELKQMEILKQASDQAGGDALMAGVEFTWAVSSLLIGFAFPGGWLASLGKNAENVGKAVEVVKTGLETLDESEVDQYWSSTMREIKEFMHFTFCKVSNWHELKHRLIGRDVAHEWYHTRYADFLLRSKVLYGLLELIDECGSPEEPEDNFEKNVTAKVKDGGYDIKGYIDNLILRPFWVKNEYLLENWVTYYHLEEDQENRDQVISLKKPDDLSNWWEVNFHRYFPIHHSEHDDIVELAKWLSVDYGGVDEDQIEAVFWQFATAGFYRTKKHGVDITDVSDWSDFGNDDEIDTETPVRVVVIFKDNIRLGVPVSFQVVRTDYGDVKGPGYSTTTRKIRKDDYIPRKYRKFNICAIAELNYARKGKVYHGIRPFAIKEESQVRSSLEKEEGVPHVEINRGVILKPVAMDMTVQISIGRGEITGCVPEAGKKDVKLAWRYWKNYQLVKLQPYLGGDGSRWDRKFLDRKFLEKYK